MQIDFQLPHHWQELNEKAAELLALDHGGGAVKLVPGLTAALNEVALGLARQFPHKRKIYFFKGMDPILEAPIAALSREGCQLQALDMKVLQDPEGLNAQIDSEALMVLVSEDDPLLGFLHDLSALESLIETKKIFLLRVSHSHHRFLALPQSFSRYLLRVNSLGGELAVILHSSRLRWPIQFAESVALSDNVLEEVKKLKNQELVNPQIIQQFEAQGWAESRAFFKAQDVRLYDRAVISWPDMDGWAVISFLAQRLKINLPAPGHNTPFETTSLHRWRAVRTMDWLRVYGFTDEMIRGTIMIDHRYINPELGPHLVQIRKEILALQNG